jgi:hypothetical protein
MPKLVADCPRCATQKMTFEVINVIDYGSEESRVEWVHRYEAVCLCAHCNGQSIFKLRDHNYEIVGKSLDRVKTFRDLKSLNDAVTVQGFVSLRDRPSTPCPDYVTDPSIKRAFDEASKCLAVGLPNAAGTMFRLCLDLSTEPLLPSPERDSEFPKPPNKQQRRDLGPRIQWLLDNHLFPPELAEPSDAIRNHGNDAAHRCEIDMTDAQDLCEFTVLVLERLFTMPGKLAESLRRREERRKPK